MARAALSELVYREAGVARSTYFRVRGSICCACFAAGGALNAIAIDKLKAGRAFNALIRSCVFADHTAMVARGFFVRAAVSNPLIFADAGTFPVIVRVCGAVLALARLRSATPVARRRAGPAVDITSFARPPFLTHTFSLHLRQPVDVTHGVHYTPVTVMSRRPTTCF
jgi:hypothetical protein